MTESGSGGETSSGGSAALPDEWDSDDADAELLALAAAQVCLAHVSCLSIDISTQCEPCG